MGDRPPFFDLLAADRLTHVIQTAVRFALRVSGQNFEGARWLQRYEEEVLLAVSVVLETGSTFQHAASFSEALYGLTRRTPGPPPTRPSTTKLALSLIAILGVPYVKHRLERLHEAQSARLRARRTNPLFTTRRENWLKELSLQLFVKAYPYGRIVTEFIASCYQILYLAGGTGYSSPLLHLLNLQIFSASPAELKHEEKMRILKTLQSNQISNSAQPVPWLQSFLQTLLKSYRALTDGLKRILIFAIFFFKALEWWYYIGEERLKEQRRLPIPPPPPAPPPHPNGIQPVPGHPELCPLCNHVRTNPTQLTVSGYVFCYHCIQRHVQERARCPITLFPATLNHLRRLYKGSTQ